MRQKRVITGLNNSQKIRVIVNGVGFYTTVLGMTEMCFTEQRVAVWCALERIAREGIRGCASRSTRAHCIAEAAHHSMASLP